MTSPCPLLLGEGEKSPPLMVRPFDKLRTSKLTINRGGFILKDKGGVGI